MPSDGTLSFGVNAAPTTYGQIGHQKSTFGNLGDAQTSQIVLMNIVPGGYLSANLFSDYPTNTVYITVFGSMAFSAQLIVMNVANGETAHFELKATFKNLFSGPTPVGTPTVISIGEDSPGTVTPKVYIDLSTGEVIVSVLNGYNDPVQCVCYVRYTETFLYI
jgi:hypothetical protein